MRRLALATAVSAMALGLGAAGAPAPIQLALPIDCTPGRDCLVQNYTDHDPTPRRWAAMSGIRKSVPWWWS